MDLVDEQHVARLERGEDRRDVLALETRPGDLTDADAELVADDLRKRRLPEPRWPGKQHMIERLTPGARRLEGDLRAAP